MTSYWTDTPSLWRRLWRALRRLDDRMLNALLPELVCGEDEWENELP